MRLKKLFVSIVIFFMLCITFVWGSEVKEKLPKRFYKNSNALLIGIEYKHDKNLKNNLNDLSGALQKRGFKTGNVEMNPKYLEDKIYDFFKDTNRDTLRDKNSQIFVWISCDSKLFEDGKRYLVQADTDGNGTIERNDCLDVKKIYNKLDETDSEHVLVVIDTEIQSYDLSEESIRGKYVETCIKSPAKQILISNRRKNGKVSFIKTFVNILEDGTLADSNHDLYLTASEIFQFLKSESQESIKEEPYPYLGSYRTENLGDFVFFLDSKPRINLKVKGDSDYLEIVDIPSGKLKIGFGSLKQFENADFRNLSVGTRPVTLKQYKTYIDDVGKRFREEHDIQWNSGKPNLPIKGVTWKEAVGYTKWLSKKQKDKNARFTYKYRLPTEEEWVYFTLTKRGGIFDWERNKNVNASSNKHFENKWRILNTTDDCWEWTCSKYTEDYLLGLPKRLESLDNDPGAGLTILRGKFIKESKNEIVIFRGEGLPSDKRTKDVTFRIVREKVEKGKN